MNISHDKIGVITITVTIVYKKISENQYILKQFLYRHTEAESILMILK